MKKNALLLMLIGLNLGICMGQDSLDTKYLTKVSSLDATLESLYGVISGEKGEARNWELFHYLFAPGAKLIPTNSKKKVNFWTSKDYEERAGEYLVKNGFFEKEIHRKVDTFGPVVQVFSTYESYRSASDEKPFSRGINSIQLLNDGKRWWVVNIYWVSESETNPIPAKYLPE